MVQRFETARLSAHRPCHDDLDDLVRMHTDAGVMATLGGRVWTAADTAAFLDRLDRHWDRHGYGVWILRERDTGSFVGRAGLRRLAIDGFDEVELLYACMPTHWGRGYTTEAADAIVRVAFDRLVLRDLVAFTLPTNAASRRVMEKAGFRYERDFIHAGLGHVLYRLRRPADAGE